MTELSQEMKLSSSRKFERITELMSDKGVRHEAFELLADLSCEIRKYREAILSIRNYVDSTPVKTYQGMENIADKALLDDEYICEKEHITKHDCCWCNPRIETMPNGHKVIIHNY